MKTYKRLCTYLECNLLNIYQSDNVLQICSTVKWNTHFMTNTLFHGSHMVFETITQLLR
jgi:hypothetical protein